VKATADHGRWWRTLPAQGSDRGFGALQLEEVAGSVSLAYRAVREAKGLLMAADGVANTTIAIELGVSRSTVLQWRGHFELDGVAWVGKVREGRGRKPVIDKAVIDKMIDDTRNTTPPDATQWSNRTMAEHSGLSRTTVQREWKARGLKPHLQKTFKISNDPKFEDKLIDVVGLYLNPPDNAIVFCFDEKSQIQALDRTQPSLPIKEGRPGTVTHDYKRNGTTTLFAALEVATGQLIGRCFARHRHEEFLAFLKLIDRQVPKGQQVHIILDNYAAHNHPDVREWLAKHKRFHFHFTPTSSSWLNLVERWFREITTKRIRRGSFASVGVLVEVIEEYIAHNNENPRPFIWTKTADQIIAKVRRGRVSLEAVRQSRVI
jgi:transposase